MLKAGLMTVLFAAGVVTFSNTACAIPIASSGTEGLSVIVASTDDIIATYLGNTASYSNDLYLSLDDDGNPVEDGDYSNDLFIFNNQDSAVGSTVNLGSFDVGVELIFRLLVTNTGNNFFTGDASRNADGYEHARVEDDWEEDTTLVSFEDLYSGPFNYNDLSFSFSNTSTVTPSTQSTDIPVPGSLLLLCVGFLPLRKFVGRAYRQPS